MIQKCYLTCCLLFLFSVGFSQNWQPFAIGESHHFRSDTANFPDRSVRIDSIRGNAFDSIWHFNRMWKTVGWDSAYIDQPNFSQRSLRVKPNGLFQLFDPGNIALYCWADSGDSWRIDTVQNLVGTVVQVYADSVLGEPDSLKLIILTGGDSLLLSKDHGLVHWPAVLGPQAYTLAGIQERHLGDTMPGFDGFFRYRPGNEYYWKSWWFQQDTPPYSTQYDWETKMVIDSVRRDSTGLTVNYSAVQRTYFQGSHVGFGSTFTSSFHLADTIGGLVSRSHGEAVPFEFCLVPYDFRRPCFNPGPGVYLGFQNIGVNTWMSTEYSRASDTTFLKLGPNVGNWVFVYSEIGPSVVNSQPLWIQQEAEFTEGLGVTYVNWQDFETASFYRLVGHIIEGDTVGTIWTDSVLLGVNHVALPANVKVHPNPATDLMHFEWRAEASQTASVQIADALGRIVISESQAHDGIWSGSVDVSKLPAGIYVLTLHSGEGQVSRRIVVE